MTINLQNTIIYGPVNSRRLGSSLGINLLSPHTKICNFNCVYCQYGWTKIKPSQLSNKDNYQETGKVLESVEKALFALSPSPKYITFSGNGEATLHPDFSLIVDGVIELRNKYAQQSRTAILSNSMNISDKTLINAISKLDEKIMKLDCGENNLLRLYNRPVKNTKVGEIVDNLKQIKDLTIQTLFTKGHDGNFSRENIKKWTSRLIDISPKMVQIYTLDRGYPSDNIYPVEIENLLEILNSLKQNGLTAKVF